MNNSFSLTCSQCGGQIQLPKGRTRIKCPYCGTEQVLTGEASQQIQQEGVQMCPVCKKDDKLEKVSAIMARETVAHPSKLAGMLTLSPLPKYDYKSPPRPPVRPQPLRQAEKKISPPVQEERKSQSKLDKNTLILYWIIGGVVFLCLCYMMAFMPYLSGSDYSSFLLLAAVVSAIIVLGYAAFSTLKPNPNPDFWDAALPSGILCLFALLIFYVSFLDGDFSLSMFLLAFGIGFVGIRHFVIQCPRTRQKEDAVSFTIPEPPLDLYKARTFEEEWEEYQYALKVYERWKVTIQEKERFQQHRLQTWNELYYCARDDIVILPREGLYTEVRDMETFVNIQANRRGGKK